MAEPVLPSTQPSTQASTQPSMEPATDPAQPGETRRDRQRAETRERLFRAACLEIDRVGLSEAQIPRIAREAGVARATFYFHFATKEDVLHELVRRLETGLIHRLAALDVHAQSLAEVIHAMLDAIVAHQAFVGESTLMREVLALQVRRAQSTEPTSDLRGLLQALAPHFAAAAQRGEIQSTIDPERLAAILLASMFGLLIGQSRSDHDLREQLRLLADLFLRGLEA